MSTSPSLPEHFDEQAKHPLHEITRTPEEVLCDLGYDPGLLRRHGFNIEGVRILQADFFANSKEQQKKQIQDLLRPAHPVRINELESESFKYDSAFRDDLLKYFGRRFYPCAFPDRKLVLLHDLSYRSTVAALADMPETEIETKGSEEDKKALQAYILLHELGHFERWYEETAPVAEALEIEAYCDRLSLKVLSEEMSSSESEHFRTGRLFILLRTMGNINRSIKSAVVPLYQNGVCDPAAPQYQVNIQRADINHATTLFLHDLNRELDCAEIVTEYKNLMEKFSLTISRHKAGFGYEINSAVIYKAAQILLSSGNADEPSLSGLQREILELYVEGLEYFCSTKCRAWKASIAEQSSSGTASRCDPEWDGPFLDSR